MGAGADLYGLRKDGSEFPAEISLGTAVGQEGGIVICAVRDLTQRKQREVELRERGLQLVVHQRNLQSLAARLVLAEESERRRIARGLHDDVGQTLIAAKMSLDALLEGDSPVNRESLARDLRSLIEGALETTRTLTFDLASAALYELGLGAALQSMCERAAQESGIRFQPPAGLEHDPIPEEIRIILFRAARELVRNVLKHSRARTARLSLSSSGTRVRLSVEDDGCGFEASEVLQSPDQAAGFGLFSITQQLDPLGGRLEITSSPGSGTLALITVPLGASGVRA